jgi:hypothetical protein
MEAARGRAGPRRLSPSRPDADPRNNMPLRTAILTMAVTFVLTVLLLRAYLTSGCQLGGRLQ